MADALEYYDGGAFADCFFVQYPGGLGQKPTTHSAIKPAPATSVNHTASTVSSATSATPSSSTALTLSVMASSSSSKPASTTVDHAQAVAETSERTRQALDGALKTAATSSATAAVPGLVNKRGLLTNVMEKGESATHVDEAEFDGANIALHRIERKNNIGKNVAANVRDLVIAVPTAGSGVDDGTNAATAPIVRSPTKTRKLATSFSSAGALTTTTPGDGAQKGAIGDEMFASDKGKDVVVPFCVSNWRNRKNLIVPLAVRVAQHEQAMGDTTSDTLGDAIIDLATSMQEASREVEAELQAKERAREEEEEKHQAALEVEEAERAKKLLQQNADRQQANFQRRETREQRLERIRLERELREREKKEKQRQRLMEKAAARLNITVEALEADEALVRAAENYGAGAGGVVAQATTGSSSSSGGGGKGVKQEMFDNSAYSASGSRYGADANGGVKRGNGGEDDDDDDDATTRLQRGGLKSSVLDVPVISNEGILREMAALQKADEDAAALRALQQQQQQQAGRKTARGGGGVTVDDGIHLRNGSGSDDSDADDVDGLEVGALLNKKRRRL